MTLLPEIRSQLLDGAFGPVRATTRRRRAGWLATAASVGVVVVVAAIGLLGLHGSGTPSRPGAGAASGPPRAWWRALQDATMQTARRDHACSQPLSVGVPDPSVRRSAPPPSITAALPSLTTPTRGARRVTRRELRTLQPDADGIYLRYAWQGSDDGVRYYVLPAAAVAVPKRVPARCRREELATFAVRAHRFAPGERAAAIAFARRQLEPRATAGVTLITIGPGGRGDGDEPVESLAQLRTQPTLGGGGSYGNDTATTTAMFVSEDVATVTATYPAQSYPGRVPRTFSVTKRPYRNVVVFELRGASDAPHLTWRSATGAVIARTPDHR